MYLSLVVQFSMTIHCPFLRQPQYYTTTPLPCQYLFRKFFEIFYSFFKSLSRLRPHGQLAYYITRGWVCQAFFAKKEKNFMLFCDARFWCLFLWFTFLLMLCHWGGAFCISYQTPLPMVVFFACHLTSSPNFGILMVTPDRWKATGRAGDF